MAIEHLLIITPGFANDEADTNCLPAVQQFIMSWKTELPNTTVSIIAMHYPLKREKYTWNGINVYPIGIKANNPIFTSAAIFKTVRTGTKITLEKKVDAILSFWLTDNAVAATRLAKKFNTPHLIWMHGQDAKPGNKFYKLLKPPAKNIAAISEWQNGIFSKAYGIKAAHVIHNGINPGIFPELNKSSRNIDLIAVGSLIPLKQYHLFIELVKDLKSGGHPSINAVIAGDGPLRKQLEVLVNQYGLQTNVHFTGTLPHQEVLELMNDSKILIHTSQYEGHSTVILEALYSGCHVLSSLPISTGNIDHFILCDDLETMKLKVAEHLSQQLVISRVTFNEMKNSVAQINGILTDMQ